jgi:hypothetical protein
MAEPFLSQLDENDAVGVLAAAVREAGRQHAVRYNEYPDMTIVVGQGLWHALIDQAQKMMFERPHIFNVSPVREGVLLSAPGGRTARVLPTWQSTADFGDHAWKLTYDTEFGGQIR